MLAWRGLQQLTNLQNLASLSLDNDEDRWMRDDYEDLHQLEDDIKACKVTELNFLWAKEIREIGEGISDEDELEALEPHPNITSLEVENFTGVRFPKWIMAMAHLKCLVLSEFYVEIMGTEFYGGDNLAMPEVVSFNSLRELEISKLRRLTTWREPPKAAFPSLETLRITDCSLLQTVPAFEFKSLTNLQLSHLHSLESVNIIKYNSGLTSIIMNKLPKIESLPQELTNCRKLQTLHIQNFGKLASLPTGLEALVNLQSFMVAHCAILNFIVDDILHIRSSLRSFEINNCPSLETIPSSLEECTMLNTLFLTRCPKIEVSQINISKIRLLCELRMSFRSAEQLRSVLESAEYLPVLRRLVIEGFRNENEMNEYFSDTTPFFRLPSLTQLMLYGYPNIKTLPEQLGMLTRITELYIWNFDDLEESPSWICNLTSLRWLIIEDCKNLKGLTSKEDLQCLTYLRITNCPHLVGRYAKDEGSEWDNISHIRKIIINSKTIQDL